MKKYSKTTIRQEIKKCLNNRKEGGQEKTKNKTRSKRNKQNINNIAVYGVKRQPTNGALLSSV